jgi:hypothetical protein
VVLIVNCFFKHTDNTLTPPLLSLEIPAVDEVWWRNITSLVADITTSIRIYMYIYSALGEF